MLFFKTKKPILKETRNEAQDNVDLQIINKMNQEFAISLDLKETLNTALKIIITRFQRMILRRLQSVSWVRCSSLKKMK